MNVENSREILRVLEAEVRQRKGEVKKEYQAACSEAAQLQRLQAIQDQLQAIEDRLRRIPALQDEFAAKVKTVIDPL